MHSAGSLPTPVSRTTPRGTILVIEDEQTIGELVRTVLTEEGYDVFVVHDPKHEPVQDAVARLEPDCILLDGTGTTGYGQSWRDATWIHERERPVPVVMFTVDAAATAEALAAATDRSRRAGFFAVLAKPFDLDALLDIVARAVAAARPTADVAADPVDPASPPMAEPQGAAPPAWTVQPERRHLLERLRREVATLQEAARRDRAEALALEARATGRSFTPEERSLARDLRLRTDANRLRLAELRVAFDAPDAP